MVLGERLVVRQARLFKRVGKGVVTDVMQQRGELEALRVGGIHAVTGFLQLGEGPAREVVGAEHVLEARVGGAGVDEEGVPELPDVPQALHRGRIDDGQRLGLQADVIPQRVADDLELFQTRGPASPTAPCTRPANCSKFLRNSSASRRACAS